MFTSIKFTTPILVLISLNSFAKGGTSSEFWYRPGGGQIDLNVGATSTATKFELKQTGTKLADADVNDSLTGFSLGYGFTPNLSMAVGSCTGSSKGKTTYVNTSTPTTENKSSGACDPTVSIDGEAGAFHYGLSVDIGTNKHKESSSSKDGDMYAGGNSYTPYIGFHSSMGSTALGIKLSYTAEGEKNTIDQNNSDMETKYTGGNSYSISPYFELSHGMGHLAIFAGYTVTADKTKTPKTGTASDEGGSKQTSAGIMGNIDFGSMVALTFNATYSTISDFNLGTSLDKAKGSGTSIGAGLRFMF